VRHDARNKLFRSHDPGAGDTVREREQETPSAPTFGGLVRTFREQRGWSQQRLADHWGFTREYVSQIERGKRKLYSEQSVMRLAEILEIPLERLREVGKYVPHQARVAGQLAEADDVLIQALLEPARVTVRLAWLVWYLNADQGVVEEVFDVACRIERVATQRGGRLRMAALELLAYANEMMGNVAFDRLHFPAAHGYFQEMHDLGRELNDPWIIALAMIHQGDVARRRGHYGDAVGYLEAAEPFASNGRLQTRGLRWQTLARSHYDFGNKPGFSRSIDSALAIGAQLPGHRDVGNNNFTYQDVCFEQALGLALFGEAHKAIEIYERPEHRTAVRPLRDRGSFTILRAQAYAHAGEIEEGVRLAIEGIALARSYDSPRHISRVQRMYDRLDAAPTCDRAALRDLRDALRAP
jgi:transcriptional regulator with XRE-family HTH domain